MPTLPLLLMGYLIGFICWVSIYTLEENRLVKCSAIRLWLRSNMI